MFDDNYLNIFNRHHNVEQVFNIIKYLEQYENVEKNIDLMYGLPGVSKEKFLKDVETIANMNVDSITLYRLRLGRIDERKALMYNDYAKSKEKFPSQLETSIQILAARQILLELGYIEFPLGWFNKPKHGSKCYVDRWLSQKPMFGLGVSAYSYGKDWQFLNSNNLNDYGNKIDKGIIPFAEGISLNKLETDLRHLAFLLRYSGKIRLSDGQKENSNSIKSIFDEIARQNLGISNDGVLELNELGKAFIDEIIDNYFQERNSYYHK